MSEKIPMDWLALKKLGKEFLDALPTSDMDSADAGFKCFTIEFLSATLTEPEELQANILIKILSHKLLEHEVKLTARAMFDL